MLNIVTCLVPLFNSVFSLRNGPFGFVRREIHKVTSREATKCDVDIDAATGSRFLEHKRESFRELVDSSAPAEEPTHKQIDA